jgi:NAD(P)-dependent dehydrogenase (short-subunit alcohol dehydrogenase family)
MRAMQSLLGLEKRRALVVGGGQGIGRATALHLARAGADVALVDLEAERAEAVAAEVRELGRQAEALAGDVTQAADARRVVEAAAERWGGLDVLVNIVGSASWGSVAELDEETWERDFAVNLKHHWYVSRSAAEVMRGGAAGAITVVASASALFSSAGHAAYGAAKAGLLSLVRTMAEEWWPQGIRVNAVVPGVVRTPRIEAAWADGSISAPTPETLSQMALPEDIAGAALFLSSALALRITGQTVIVDGGGTTRFPYAMS